MFRPLFVARTDPRPRADASLLLCPIVEARLVRLIPNESHNHAIQIEEEHDQVETQLNERFLNQH